MKKYPMATGGNGKQRDQKQAAMPPKGKKPTK